MIITRNWLNEWIDISNIATEKILSTLNSIGLEVGSYEKIEIPNKIVIGYVKSRHTHENSDHLSVCEVDVGNETLQIVCGAKNVEAGQFVPVSLVGAVLPSGLEIKPAKLRGIQSFGMICSATELGLAKTNDGIMVLDDSIGELVLGKNLNEYESLNDEIIEVDLTPNRGDCLSIYGIARDLSAALNIPLRDFVAYENDEKLLGIGRILGLHYDEQDGICLAYKAFEIKETLKSKILRSLRLAYVGNLGENGTENLLKYTTHSTGVLLRAYDFHKICGECEKITLDIVKEKDGQFGIYHKNKLLSYAGISQVKDYKIDENTKIAVIEASYTTPEIISAAVGENKSLKGDEQVYRASRGSETNLELGLDFLRDILSQNKSVVLYAGMQQISPFDNEKIASFSVNEINKMVGTEILANDIIKILKRLDFEVGVENELITAKVPKFRHDIVNSHDICEEIVRIIGIDNIVSKPLIFAEKTRLNETFFDYQNSKKLRNKAANVGFFECVHYVFDDSKELENLGFTPCKVEILNPITSELNALRPTLINHLLNSASRNIKNSKKSIKLFEFGSVFDENGTQSEKFGFVASGLKAEPSLLNGAKGENVDFIYFANLIQSVIGKFSCEIPNEKFSFLNEFEQANIMQNGICVGFIGRVNAGLENSKDLFKTYIAQIDFKALKFDKIEAKNYSKFPSISRDLSVIVPNSVRFFTISKAINALKIADLKEFFPVDIYEDKSLNDAKSITIKFAFQNMEKTLEDAEIEAKMAEILKALNSLGLNLR